MPLTTLVRCCIVSVQQPKIQTHLTLPPVQIRSSNLSSLLSGKTIKGGKKHTGRILWQGDAKVYRYAHTYFCQNKENKTKAKTS